MATYSNTKQTNLHCKTEVSQPKPNDIKYHEKHPSTSTKASSREVHGLCSNMRGEMILICILKSYVKYVQNVTYGWPLVDTNKRQVFFILHPWTSSRDKSCVRGLKTVDTGKERISLGRH